MEKKYYLCLDCGIPWRRIRFNGELGYEYNPSAILDENGNDITSFMIKKKCPECETGNIEGTPGCEN